MAEKNTGGFPGHDEGTNKPPSAAGANVFQGGSTFAPLSQEANSVNTKTDLGTGGKVEGEK